MRYTMLLTRTLTVLLVAFVMITPAINAERAVRAEADLVCENWISNIVYQKGSWSGDSSPYVAGAQEIITHDTLVGWFYSVEPQGYVVVPVLKELPPVKASSEDYNLDITEENGPAALFREILLDGVRVFAELYGSIDATQPTRGEIPFGTEYRAQWDRYAVSRETFDAYLAQGSRGSLVEVGPLLTASWHQSDPYKMYCPPGDGGQTVVGCVATAAAMIMDYHEWPPFGDGIPLYWWNGDNSCGGSTPGMYLSVDCNDSYDWPNIPDVVTTGSPQEQQEATANLCYEVGVAYHMHYGRCGSGAYLHMGEWVYATYFRYMDSVVRTDRPGHEQWEWFDMCRGEIDKGRPISYAITYHAIVLDGYRTMDGLNQFHFNYGWNSSHTTWYTIDEPYCPWEGCSPGDQMMLTGIIPDRGIVFTADTTIGWLPLDVQFEGSSDLSVDDWTYDFGDGDSAFIQSPTHIYDAPGRYDVSLQIQADELARTMVRSGLIIAIADTLATENYIVVPDSTLEVVIYARNSAPVDQIKIPVQFGGDLELKLDSFSTAGCRTDYFEYVAQIQYSPISRRTTFKLLSTTSGLGPELSPGAGPVLRLFFSTPPEAELGQLTSIDLQGYLSYQPIYYGSILDYQPIPRNGSVLCASCCSGYRGNIDADPDDQITISDLVYLVDYMFNNGPEPACFKEANLDGTSIIDVSDLVILVEYMFNGGPQPIPCLD